MSNTVKGEWFLGPLHGQKTHQADKSIFERNIVESTLQGLNLDANSLTQVQPRRQILGQSFSEDVYKNFVESVRLFPEERTRPDVVNIMEVLKHNQLFSTIPTELLEFVATNISVEDPSPDRAIYDEDDVAKRFYIICTGLVNLIGMEDEQPYVSSQMYPGEAFGEEAMNKEISKRRWKAVPTPGSGTPMLLVIHKDSRDEMEAISNRQYAHRVKFFRHDILDTNFRHLSEESLLAMVKMMDVIHVDREQVIMQQRQHLEQAKVYFVKRGYLKMSKTIRRDGESSQMIEIELASFSRGSSFGSFTTAVDVPAPTASIVAEMDTELFSILTHDLQSFIDQANIEHMARRFNMLIISESTIRQRVRQQQRWEAYKDNFMDNAGTPVPKFLQREARNERLLSYALAYNITPQVLKGRDGFKIKNENSRGRTVRETHVSDDIKDNLDWILKTGKKYGSRIDWRKQMEQTQDGGIQLNTETKPQFTRRETPPIAKPRFMPTLSKDLNPAMPAKVWTCSRNRRFDRRFETKRNERKRVAMKTNGIAPAARFERLIPQLGASRSEPKLISHRRVRGRPAW